MSTSFQSKYYEQEEFWNHDYFNNEIERKRITQTAELIPNDVKSLIDVGCGNGAFINSLSILFPNRFDEIVGIDSSQEALKYVTCTKLHGSITNLPYENDSFDLVTCMEVLEHLTHYEYIKAISELKRVSKKYILITVPNKDNLELSTVMCSHCSCWFNSHFHMRSFDQDSLKYLFNDCKPTFIKEIGPVNNNLIPHGMIAFLWHFFRKPYPSANAICPQCGYEYKTGSSGTDANNHKELNICLRVAKMIMKPLVYKRIKKSRWLLALYTK